MWKNQSQPKRKEWTVEYELLFDACGLTAHCHSVGQLCTTALVWRRRTEGKTGLTIRYRPSWRRRRKINERKGDLKEKKRPRQSVFVEKNLVCHFVARDGHLITYSRFRHRKSKPPGVDTNTRSQSVAIKSCQRRRAENASSRTMDFCYFFFILFSGRVLFFRVPSPVCLSCVCVCQLTCSIYTAHPRSVFLTHGLSGGLLECHAARLLIFTTDQ